MNTQPDRPPATVSPTATLSPTLIGRRLLVVGGVVASLLLGAATIRAAAGWADATGLATSQPVSAETLAAQLAAEEARSAALRAQLADLAARSRALTDALAAAQDQLATDAATAEQLRSQLAAARERIAQLEASLAAQAASVSGGSTGPAPARGGHDERERDEHGGGGEHDDD